MESGLSKNGRAASEQWLRETLARHEAPLIRYAARLTGSVERARDVVQDAFTRLCQQDRAGLDGRVTQWLYTVCRNRALTVRRKEMRMTTLSDAAAISRVCPDPVPPAAAEQRESRSHVLSLMAGLPDNQQEVLVLKFQSGLSYREIAGVLAISVTNVGFLIHTAIKSLRERMGSCEGMNHDD